MTTKDLDSANADFQKLLAEVEGGDAGGKKDQGQRSATLSDERKAELRAKYPHLDPLNKRR